MVRLLDVDKFVETEHDLAVIGQSEQPGIRSVGLPIRIGLLCEKEFAVGQLVGARRAGESELIGGLDILKEMHASGDLEPVLPKKQVIIETTKTKFNYLPKSFLFSKDILTLN